MITKALLEMTKCKCSAVRLLQTDYNLNTYYHIIHIWYQHRKYHTDNSYINLLSRHKRPTMLLSEQVKFG